MTAETNARKRWTGSWWNAPNAVRRRAPTSSEKSRRGRNVSRSDAARPAENCRTEWGVTGARKLSGPDLKQSSRLAVYRAGTAGQMTIDRSDCMKTVKKYDMGRPDAWTNGHARSFVKSAAAFTSECAIESSAPRSRFPQASSLLRYARASTSGEAPKIASGLDNNFFERTRAAS